jgi:hypothetical protein
MTVVRILASEWDLLTGVAGAVPEPELVREVLRLGAGLAHLAPVERLPPEDADPAEALAATRLMFAQRAARFAEVLHRYLADRPEAERLRAEDDRAIAETERLEREAIPALEARIATLERALGGRGGRAPGESQV